MSSSVPTAWTEPQTETADPTVVEQYARLVDPARPRSTLSDLAPPLFPIVPALGVVIDAVRAALGSSTLPPGVQTGFRTSIEQLVVPGTPVASRARVDRVLAGRNETIVHARVESRDQHAELIADSELMLLLRAQPPTASRRLDQGRPRAGAATASAAPPGTVTTEVRVGADLPATYGAVSGDTNPIHHDDAAARAAGFDGIVLQGMATLALVVSTAVVELGDGDPGGLAELAARLAGPVMAGQTLRTTFRPERRRAYRFDTDTESGPALRRAMVRFR